MTDKQTEKHILTLFNNPLTKEKGFNLLINTYKEPIYFQIRRMLSNHQDTDDVLQEVFVKCWRNLHQFKENAKLATWLYKIAYNESLMWLRKNNKHQNLALESVGENKAPQTTIFSKNANEISMLLEKAIRTLPEKQKYIFQLKYFEDLSYKEIQEITGGSIGGLKASYHHAVKKIKINLGWH